MALDAKYEFLRDRALRALGDHQVNEAVGKIRAIVGPLSISDDQPAAQAALDKLRQGQMPTAEELTALEIVIRLLRPVVFAHNGALDDLPDRDDMNLQPKDLKGLWTKFKTAVKPLVGSVGRVELKKDGAYIHIGTGFIVAGGMLATNHHVLSDMTFGSDALGTNQVRAVFKQEEGLTNMPGDIVAIESVVAVHPELDIALFALAKHDRPAVAFATAVVSKGDRVVTIGFPARDEANNPFFLDGIFREPFGVKRAALGEVLLVGSQSPAFFHDCSTLSGNSGSPVFSLTSGCVAGIHRGGTFMYRNEAVSGEQLRSFVQSRA